MKSNTMDLVKFQGLKRRLRLPRYQAAGLLESLWHFCFTNARDGNLSRFTAFEIASWLEWDGDDQELIEALVECRWLDRDGKNLRVHDWFEHCPTWIKGLAQRGQLSTELSPELSSELSPALSPLLPKPIPKPKPKPTPKTKKKSAAPPLVFPEGLDVPEFKDAWGRWVAYRKEIKKPLTKSMVQAQLKKLNSMGLRHAVECIDHTIAMGWQGLRQPDTNGKSDGSHNAAAYNADLAKRVQATKEYLRR